MEEGLHPKPEEGEGYERVATEEADVGEELRKDSLVVDSTPEHQDQNV